MKKPKLIVFGHKQHGKDTFCEYVRDTYGLSFESSSMYACKAFLFDKLKDSHGYSSIEECYEDRVNHRALWYDEIVAYNTPDKARLGKELFAKYDVYCGIRNLDEFNELKNHGLFDLAIYVDASKRLPLEDESSMTMSIDQADIVISNNESKERFYASIDNLFKDIDKLIKKK